MLSFIATRLFTKLATELRSDEEYSRLQEVLIRAPEAGDLIPGSGGVRKVRWSVKGRGKRGGVRVIYCARTRQG